MSDRPPPAMNPDLPDAQTGVEVAVAGRDAPLVRALNDECFCIGLDDDALRYALESALVQPSLADLVRERCPYVFAARPVFIADTQLQRMAAVTRAVESVVAVPAYREQVLAGAPAIARHDAGGARSVFFGYDFHVDGDRLGLIEINTNAGGAMLNAVLARAQRACCAAIESLLPGAAGIQVFEQQILAMFRNEWRLSGRTTPLRRIAIVDDTPAQQYLYPEFLLFQRLFERHGLEAIIADPSELTWQGGALRHERGAIDLVYNRLTDFALELPSSAPLREAYLERAVVLTPHPRAHALYADKRNLALLSDGGQLAAIGAPADVQDILLANIPRTEVVNPAQAERLWSERRRLFFKPTAGYGGRAAYRGDKVTKKVWQDILGGDYVAQEVVAPGQRVIDDREARQVLKFDIRNYAYDGRVQWVAARLYQGQTTNFRTPGGGFAPVYGLPAFDEACDAA